MIKYFKIIKYHGLLKGLRRSFDEFVEIDLFDFFNNVSTSKIKNINDYEKNKLFNSKVHKHYQPTYFSPLKKITLFIMKKILYKKIIVVDLGTGYGKPLLIIGNVLKSLNNTQIKLIGIDLENSFKKIFNQNMNNFFTNSKNIKTKFENSKIEKFNFNFEEGEFCLIIHNKNSFSKEITLQNINKIKKLKKTKKIQIFYIFSNPEFKNIFKKKKIFQTKGWHKNFNIDLFEI